MNAQIDFEALYTDADPFHYRTRWYEQRKRDLLLAMLPARRYARGWEWGCSNGELTAALATRCDALIATDVSSRAVLLARQRLAALDHVDVRCMAHPKQWPEERIDLVVFSEVGYYLGAADFERTLALLSASHGAQTLVACHWRAPFAQARRTGDEVHAALAQQLGGPALCYRDEDMRLECWPAGEHSVAQQDGLR